MRSELFGLGQLESYAKLLARGHRIDPRPRRERLLQRLRENERVISRVYLEMSETAGRSESVSPAVEWLLDNDYLIHDQIALAREYLPRGYSRQLPRLGNGSFEGLPRVYSLAYQLISHTDGRVDLGNVSAFIRAYQSVVPLKLGELWAVPVMLRLALIENLRRVAERIERWGKDRALARHWAQQFLAGAKQPRDTIVSLAEFVRLGLPNSRAFIAEFTANLYGQHSSLGLVMHWLEQQLAEKGQSPEQLQQAESLSQASDQVSIGNSITSLRTIGGVDWRRFVEEQSLADAALRRDPMGTYASMDFRTRDTYRHVVEQLARQGQRDEIEVAETVVNMAAARRQDVLSDRLESHIGFFLVDKGREDLERAVGCDPPISRRLGRRLARYGFTAYLIVLGMIVVVMTGAVAWLLQTVELGRPRLAALLAACAALVVTRPALSLLHWSATLLVPPRSLPRMDFSGGIPVEYSTAVVVPAMLDSRDTVRRLLEKLEIRYLGNRGPNLYYALLTDMPDAPQQQLPGDREVLVEAVRGVRSLNRRYGERGKPVFFLLHRPRYWNAGEGVWMGYERKRGKLIEFNRLLRTGERGGYGVIVGDTDRLRAARCVITLDADTQLPPGTAWKMVATLAHPLNRPVVNPKTRCVDKGYGVLQPRIAINLESAVRSRFARLHAGEIGIDPYSREVSNVYHDLFARSPFIGKGVYDRDTFDVAVGGRFPENTVLSHDLIEGVHARCGFINDVELIEDHPSRYLADIDRQHRWVRGDWQVAAWLMPRVPDATGRRGHNSLDALSRFMIFDNLRRSLVPAALLFLLVGGWLSVPVSPAVWLLCIAGIWLSPDLIRTIYCVLLKPPTSTWRGHLTHVAGTEGRHLTIILLQWAFLPYEAFVYVHAACLAVWRKAITRRRLLEWQTAHDADKACKFTQSHTWARMWVAPATAVLCGVAVYVLRGPQAVEIGPILLAWALSPFLAWWLSALPRKRTDLSPDRTEFLHGVARRTWLYFERLTSAETHWLPPDNFQEHPEPRLAERTSPTNIGMGLLGTLAASDFGFISAGELMDRTEKTLASMDKLERYRGHFLNWYSTRTLETLSPRYVSSVDSGNLIACLITLRHGLAELTHRPIVSPRWREGLRHTASVLLGEMDRAAAEQQGADAAFGVLRKRLEALANMERPSWDLWAIEETLDQWCKALSDITLSPHTDPQVVEWLAILSRQAEKHRNDLLYLAPWRGNGPGALLEKPFEALMQGLGLANSAVPTLGELAALHRRVALAMQGKPHTDLSKDQGSDRLVRAIANASERAALRITSLHELGQRCTEMSDTDLDFLFDSSRKLLSIGFNLDSQKLDPSNYDLLASEARITSFLGIAQGKLPLEHWFLLNRQVTGGIGPPTLVSWSGSMFEYLMPLLYMPSFETTLLHQSYLGAVGRQIHYGRSHGIPWGISESCYNLLNIHKDYQYRAFGVPSLGLKRGLGNDLVLAPYASAMALMVAPREACDNMRRMRGLGMLGKYGFYEAMDYTASRVPHGQPFSIVRSFMAHHSGMSLLAMAYLLLDRPMQRRFIADPEMNSATLLLQERVTAASGRAVHGHASEAAAQVARPGASHEPSVRTTTRPDSPVPDVHLLSNGQYHVMVTSAGAGFSRWRNLAVTRWREDPTRDCWGTCFYLRDSDSGNAWSTTWQPMPGKPDGYRAVFSQGRAEFRRVDRGIEVCTEIAVSTEADVELRRMTITNQTDKVRTLELTSYAEIVLADERAEASHPVFNSLFIETQTVPDRSAVICTRRARAKEESPPWAFHTLVVRGNPSLSAVSFETDRSRFLGRLRNPADPVALETPGPLSNTAGAVLDPVFSIRRSLRLLPRQSVVVDAFIGLAATRQEVTTLLDRHHDPRIADRIFDIAWTHSQVLMNQLRITEADAELFLQLAGSILYANRRYRANPSLVARNAKGQSSLWSYGISGDLPIVLVKIADRHGLDLARKMIQAHGFWRHKGLHTDLVIWTEAYAGYRHRLFNDVVGLINSSGESPMLDRPGGFFVRSIDQVPEADRLLLQSVARLVLSDRGGSLAEQVRRRVRFEPEGLPLRPVREPQHVPIHETDLPQRDLKFFNGWGGFTHDGREYVTVLLPGDPTPAPWANVLANEQFGSVVTESGGGYTWFRNAHEYRLTPWCNDPVSDTVGEAIYLRDEETGQYWSVTSSPAPGPTPYVCRHGLGYTAHEHTQHRIFTELMTYVAVDAPVKVMILTLRNLSKRDRSVSVTGYCEWVLGDLRGKNAMHVVTQMDAQTGAIFASNAYSNDFAGCVGFFQTSESDRTWTADRTEFLGRNGSHARPSALSRQRLSNRVGAGLDPCAALQAYVEIPAGEQREVVFVLGAADGEPEARAILERFSGNDGARQGLEAVWQFWKHLLGGVYVETPDPSVDFLVNNWLLYQVLACRFWGRSGFYQSGGAFGFRDQLQDSMAFVHECPWLLRQHLLTCAHRQFRDGDVQHWWHPPTGRGVRTKISDDYLWLPYAACRYVRGTGDTGVLDEPVPFLEARSPGPDEESSYDMPTVLGERATLYDHCVLAIRHGMRLGEHGLPLMGWGDWNDGMNHVGKAGQGESVWLAFFLFDVLRQFQEVAELHSDPSFAAQCRRWAEQLRLSIQIHGWDGAWYRRAYFDDGTPLGSSQSPECQIDLLPQCWAVFSGADDPQRAALAMQSATDRLVDERLKLIRLFDPPFDKAAWDPGYIKGYLPGVRENGGQYTHAAVWAVMAAAALKQPEQAWRLFGLINPIRHGDTWESAARYKVEPYVVAADVYTAAGHEGRGGWTWYTGSASWMYRLLVEELLGLKLEVDKLTITPILPAGWKGYTLHYRFRETVYHIHVSVVGPETWNVRRLVVDESEQPDGKIHLADDHRDHAVLVEVG